MKPQIKNSNETNLIKIYSERKNQTEIAKLSLIAKMK